MVDDLLAAEASRGKPRPLPPIATEMGCRTWAQVLLSSAKGHLKADHRMDRNHLAHSAGDAINAVLAAVGYNFRLADVGAPRPGLSLRRGSDPTTTLIGTHRRDAAFSATSRQRRRRNRRAWRPAKALGDTVSESAARALTNSLPGGLQSR